ncbi:MAG: hypothetical protein ACOVQ4_16410 [Flectobacillus sp.]|uniref:hypothetical protein n=1 Tax=Flectobacillus sp. TaxID=50419 RepID=UPI003B9C5D6B
MNTLQKYFEEVQFIELSNREEVSRYRKLRLVVNADWNSLLNASKHLEKISAVFEIQIMDLSSGDTPSLCGMYRKQRNATPYYRAAA